MTTIFDRIVIAVPDLPEAIAQYQQLLGAAPLPRVNCPGGPAAWLALPNTIIELVQSAVAEAVIRGIVFSDSFAGPVDAQLANSLGLDLYLGDGSASADFRRQYPHSCSTIFKVDHLVLRSRDATACVALFGKQLGIRLALDKTVPEWGGRMLFFRAGKLTLEVIESGSDPGEADGFWGIALQCPDIDDMALRLARSGIALSTIRQGRKPGTRVATIKSHCLGIPTLLLEPATS